MSLQQFIRALQPGDLSRLFATFARAADFSTERDRRIHDALSELVAANKKTALAPLSQSKGEGARG